MSIAIKNLPDYPCFIPDFAKATPERISLINDDIKIKPKAIAPPIFIVVTSPSAKVPISPKRQDSIVRKTVSPGTSGIIPGIRYTVAGTLKKYAASSEYKAIATPDIRYGNTNDAE